MEGTALVPVTLASTVDTVETTANGSSTTEQNGPRFVPRIIRLSDIDRDENQPRATARSVESQESLISSVRTNGLFSVPFVRPGEAGRFTLITGEGRYEAAVACGYTEILCLVCESPLAPEETLRMQFAENMFREPLNPIDQAALFRSLMRDRGWSQNRLAKFLGISQGRVGEYVKLLKLPADIRDRVARGTLGVRAAHKLAERRNLSTVDSEEPKAEPEPSPFTGDDPFDGVTLHPNQSWIDKATGLMFAVGRRSKRAVTDKEILRALKARLTELESRLELPTPNP
jgi:ParB family chromosome partitioning protein